MKRGLFIVQLPPPVHGVAVMNAHVVSDRILRNHVCIDVLQLAYSRELGQLNRATAAKFGRWLLLLFALWRRLAKERPDFAYFTPVPTGAGYVRDLPFMLLIKAYRVPLILHLHGRGIREQAARPLWRALYRWGMGHCAVVSASPGMQQHELAQLDLPGGRLYVVPNTVERVDTRRFSREGRSDALRLLFLSSTFAPKGIFVLLESLRRLLERGVAFDVDIVGASTARHDRLIEEFVLAHGLAPHAHLRGALYGDDKNFVLANADVLVHPTLNDYFPLVILEALQFGLAIVATRMGAIPEMVVNGVHGMLVPAGDVVALTQALEDLSKAPEQVRRMGEASRCRYEQHYSPERFSTALLGVFEAEGVA